MKTSEILEVIAAPEVQEQREKLYQLGAPVGKLQQEALQKFYAESLTLDKDEAIVFVANCLLQRVKEWEAKRQPRTRAGRVIKWIIGMIPSFGK